jgi:chromatin remodeling complex protein RSC6
MEACTAYDFDRAARVPLRADDSPTDANPRSAWALELIATENAMARSAKERGEQETAAAEKKVEQTGKPVKGARGGITAPMMPSAELAEVVGEGSLPRSEVVSKVWDYIKKHGLQDPNDKRNIIADTKLGKVFGKKSATMFEMNKLLSSHLSAEKV